MKRLEFLGFSGSNDGYNTLTLARYLCDEKSPQWKRVDEGWVFILWKHKRKKGKLEIDGPVSVFLDPLTIIWGWINLHCWGDVCASYGRMFTSTPGLYLWEAPPCHNNQNVSTHRQMSLGWGRAEKAEAAKLSLVEKYWPTWKFKFIALESFLRSSHLCASWPPNNGDFVWANLGLALSSAMIVLWP